MKQARSFRTRRPVSGFEQPGAFQCTILRALELPKAHREVFLLKDSGAMRRAQCPFWRIR